MPGDFYILIRSAKLELDRRGYPSPAIPKPPCVMNVESATGDSPTFVPGDDLERLQLKIAQRADDISREAGFDPTNALENWRIAEREVFGRTRSD